MINSLMIGNLWQFNDTSLIIIIIMFGQTGQTPFSDRPNSEKCRAKFREKDSPRGWRISEQAESLTNHPSECRPEPTKCEFIRWTEHPLLISLNSLVQGGARDTVLTPQKLPNQQRLRAAKCPLPHGRYSKRGLTICDVPVWRRWSGDVSGSSGSFSVKLALWESIHIDPREIDGTYLIHVNSIIHLWMFIGCFSWRTTG